MKIRWFGHACFSLESMGKTILIDPFDESVGYQIPDITPDVVLESHQHFDHAAHNLVKGDFELVGDPSSREIAGFAIKGYRSFHDEQHGSKRGDNILFEVTTPEGIRVLHCGDLGHMLSEDTIEKLKEPHVFMVPVGGVYTIDGKIAADLCKLVYPNIVIPMHYKTPPLKFGLSSANEFLESFEDIEEKKDLSISSPADVEEFRCKVIVLDYKQET